MKRKQITDKYTRAFQFDGGWAVYFVVGVQSFKVADNLESEKEAEWFQKMLAIAIQRLLKSEKSLTAKRPSGKVKG